MADVWVAVRGIGSGFAALFALGALDVAWLAFKEGGRTIIELQKPRAAATEETAAASPVTPSSASRWKPASIRSFEVLPG